MWLNDEGVMNTVALPDPSVVMSPSFVSSLRRLVEAHAEDISTALDELEDEIFEQMWNYDATVESEFVGSPPSGILLVGHPDSVESLVREIGGVDSRWRLDALMATQDMAESF
jgi:hypothetical protein